MSRGDKKNTPPQPLNVPQVVELATSATIEQRKLRFHLLGFAHLPMNQKYNCCAFTLKMIVLSEMLVKKGHEVIAYCCEGSDVLCSEMVQTHTLKHIRDAFGDPLYKGDDPIGYDWQNEVTGGFRNDFGDEWPKGPLLKRYVQLQQVAEVELRKRPDDFLLMPMGQYHRFQMEQLRLFLSVEPGIGCYAYCAPDFRVYESAALRMFSRGEEKKSAATDGKHYFTVIPNYYRLADYPFTPVPLGDHENNNEPYAVYLGRMIMRKGIQIAIEATKRANMRLIIAGQGGRYDPSDHSLSYDNLKVMLGPKQRFMGFCDRERRKTLLGNATIVFCPSIFIEPFCGVSAEAQLCGTPVACTNYGALTENVEHGRTGWQCQTLNEFVLACAHAHRLDRHYIRKRAQSLWSVDVVAEQYNRYFQNLYDVYLSTLDSKTPNRGFNRIRTREEEVACGTTDFGTALLPFDRVPILDESAEEGATWKTQFATDCK